MNKDNIIDIEDLTPDAHNFNRGTDEGRQLMQRSLTELGAGRSILVDRNGNVIAGNKTQEAAIKAGIRKVRVIETDGTELVAVKRTDIDIDSAKGRELALVDNLATQVNLAWDEAELEAMDVEGFDPASWGYKTPEEQAAEEEEKERKKQEREIKQLKDVFVLPPMSVLDTRVGLWIQRRNYWLEKTGIRSFLGRKACVTFGITAQGSSFYEKKNDLRIELGREPTTDEVIEAYKADGGYILQCTSTFDPVLCELMYRWYNVKNGIILDPFAGGSVRGVMACQLMMEYHGNDLSADQITENRLQASEAFDNDWHGPIPRWTIGDSQHIDTILEADGYGDTQFDMIFSCPPYADLEVYSKDPDDISNMPYNKFLTIYREIIRKSCEKLKDNRFAVFVVSEVRGKNGEYYDFVGDTIKAFKDAGLIYYNELILVNQVASKAMIARKGFSQSRKIGRHHQNVLVFAKGDPQKVNDLFEDINVRKGIEQFNEQRTISDKHSKVLVFFKGDQQNIRLDYEETTPPDPKWEDITIAVEKDGNTKETAQA